MPRSSDKKKSKKDKKEKEAKREKERAQAEAIDKEILGKKTSLERPKSKAPKPPKTYFTDNNKTTPKIDLPSTVSTSERKKNFLQSIENKDSTATKKNTINKKKDLEHSARGQKDTEVQQRQQVKESEIQENTTNARDNSITTNNTNGTIDKKPSQKDRSVDVYHETVRQRATRSTEPVKDVFPGSDQDSTMTRQKPGKKKQRAPQHPQKDINDEELPSVRELRSKFETSKNGAKKVANSPSSSPSKKSSKIDFKKGFNVMSSLTRRSAMSVSKSMQNLSIDSKKEDSKKSDSSAESGIIMEFSHFTFAETSDPQDEAVHPPKNQVQTVSVFSMFQVS